MSNLLRKNHQFKSDTLAALQTTAPSNGAAQPTLANLLRTFQERILQETLGAGRHRQHFFFFFFQPLTLVREVKPLYLMATLCLYSVSMQFCL